MKIDVTAADVQMLTDGYLADKKVAEAFLKKNKKKLDKALAEAVHDVLLDWVTDAEIDMTPEEGEEEEDDEE